jgi:hypothetical protein
MGWTRKTLPTPVQVQGPMAPLKSPPASTADFFFRFLRNPNPSATHRDIVPIVSLLAAWQLAQGRHRYARWAASRATVSYVAPLGVTAYPPELSLHKVPCCAAAPGSGPLRVLHETRSVEGRRGRRGPGVGASRCRQLGRRRRRRR